MTETYAQTIATSLAAFSAAAFVCALFYPILAGDRHMARRDRIVAAFRRGAEETVPASRNIRRAQEFALKAVAENSRSCRSSRLHNRLTTAGLQWTRQRFVAASLMLGAVLLPVGAAAGLPFAVALPAAALGAWLLPLRALVCLASRRRKKFLAGFTEAVDMILRGAKSGLSVIDCLNMVAADADALIRKEFAAIVAQLRAGVPLPEAMAKFSAAMPAPEVRFFALIMSIQSQTGGNLSDALGNLAKLLRDREQLAAKVRVASAEVKASAIAVGIMPFVVIGATAMSSPGYIELLWTDPAGRSIAVLAVCWLVIGIAVLQRMARIEV